MLVKRICDMQVREIGYTVDWAIGWPPGDEVANELNLRHGISVEPMGTMKVPMQHVPRGFIIGGKYLWHLMVGGRFYPATPIQLQLAQKKVQGP